MPGASAACRACNMACVIWTVAICRSTRTCVNLFCVGLFCSENNRLPEQQQRSRKLRASRLIYAAVGAADPGQPPSPAFSTGSDSADTVVWDWEWEDIVRLRNEARAHDAAESYSSDVATTACLGESDERDPFESKMPQTIKPHNIATSQADLPEQNPRHIAWATVITFTYGHKF